MSTKTFRHIWPFLLASLLVHAALAYFFFYAPEYLASFSSFFEKKHDEKSPMFVQVVDVPDWLKSSKKKRTDKPRFASNRDISVDKEEFTDTPKTRLPRPQSAASPKVNEKAKTEVKEKKPVEDALKVLKNGSAPVKTVKKDEASENNGDKSLFPTEERLRELAKIYEAESPKAEKGKTLSLNTSELKYQKYILNLRRKIELYWEYPEASARKGEEGMLVIDFTITRSGEVKNVRLIKPSPYPALNDAAVTAVKLSSPFNPFPKDFDINDVNIRGNFEYRLIGRP